MKRYLYIFVATLLLLLPQYAKAQHKSTDHIIGFYNLENLFDIYDDPVKNDGEYLPDGKNKWTAAKYQKKLTNMASVIKAMAVENHQYHTLLGISEIENRHVVEDLVSQPSIVDANYQIIHYDSPDRRGVDVALLYDPEQFTYIDSESLPFTFDSPRIDFVMSKENQEYFKTRDILMVHGLIDGEDVAVYVAHLPSRVGDKKGSSQLRSRGAEIIYDHAMMMMEKYPGIKVIAMGDMNDNPTDESMDVYLHGMENIKEVGTEDFFSPFRKMLKDGYGSLAYRGVWSIYDLILVNKNLIDSPDGSLKIKKLGNGYYGRIFKKPFLLTKKGAYKGYPFRTFSNGSFLGGYSDHLPTYIVIGK